MASVMSKSAMRPSLHGRIASIRGRRLSRAWPCHGADRRCRLTRASVRVPCFTAATPGASFDGETSTCLEQRDQIESGMFRRPRSMPMSRRERPRKPARNHKRKPPPPQLSAWEAAVRNRLRCLVSQDGESYSPPAGSRPRRGPALPSRRAARALSFFGRRRPPPTFFAGRLWRPGAGVRGASPLAPASALEGGLLLVVDGGHLVVLGADRASSCSRSGRASLVVRPMP